MARSDLVLALVQAASERDDLLLKRTVDALVADERSKRHATFASRIVEIASRPRTAAPRMLQARLDDLALEIVPRKRLTSLYLAPEVDKPVHEFIEEHLRASLLRSYGLEPRNRMLLTGAPGNGKTSLAESIAEALSIPLLLVRYEGVVANLLGDTARRLSALMDQISGQSCVLFFDEFDAIGKSRGDDNESGEIKRLVTALLGHFDRLAPHVILIAATNYPELLDRAVWRRFQIQLDLRPPNSEQLRLWVSDFYSTLTESVDVSKEYLAEHLQGCNYSDLEDFRNSVQRRYVLGLPGASLSAALQAVLSQIVSGRSVVISGGTTTSNTSVAATDSARRK